MKNIVVSLLIVLSLPIISLTSCIADQDIRPQGDDDEIWVCEEPYAYFSHDSESDLFLGKLSSNDLQYDFFEYESTGSYMAFFKPEAIVDNVINPEGNTLLSGSVEYFEGYFVLTVKNDPENIFSGKLPIMKFVRYSLDDFEEKFSTKQELSAIK